ncbi:MAG: hypothetical protein Q7S17_05825, partial [Xanthobacteraceae bacterium]|nr:hypothetical protein [Xanthobacteraceae bacterium]
MAGERVVNFEGAQHTFPADATDAEIAAALDQRQPAAPASAASQSDVRWSEPAPQSPMAAFNTKAQGFGEVMQRFTAKTGGVLKPGQNVRQAAAEWSGTPDPESERALAEIEEVAQGGDLQYGNSVGYGASKLLASVGGFAAAGPAGATAAESLVRYVALAKGLEKALDAGAINYDRAAEIMAKEMTSGLKEDAAWNFAVPLLGQVLKHLPGARNLVAKVAAKLKPGAAPNADLAEQSAAKVAARADDAATPAAKQAVEELSSRMGPYVPTPGQVTGEASFGEQIAR